MSATSSNLARAGICSMIRRQLTDFDRSIIQPLLPNQPQGVGREDDGKVLGRRSDQRPFGLHPFRLLQTINDIELRKVQVASRRNVSQTRIPVAAISALSRSRLGGSFRYSMTTGSSSPEADHRQDVAPCAALRVVLDGDGSCSAPAFAKARSPISAGFAVCHPRLIATEIQAMRRPRKHANFSEE